MQEASNIFHKDRDFHINFITLAHDKSTNQVSRSIPVCRKDGPPDFIWDGLMVIWVEARRELMQRRDKEFLDLMEIPVDRQRHRTKICFL